MSCTDIYIFNLLHTLCLESLEYDSRERRFYSHNAHRYVNYDNCLLMRRIFSLKTSLDVRIRAFSRIILRLLTLYRIYAVHVCTQ